MNEESNIKIAPSKKVESPLANLMFGGHLKITLNVAGITVGTMMLVGTLGYWLDAKLGTKPLLLVVGLVLAFPLIQIAIYKKFQKITDNLAKAKSEEETTN